MKQIFLDTETTGLEPEKGHRIIEVAAVAYENRRPLAAEFHHQLNPEREIDEEAVKVHGLTEAVLADKPRFAEIADELIAFLRGGEVIMHNAEFDAAFLNSEFARAGRPPLTDIAAKITDTVEMSRRIFPNRSASLDALIMRLGLAAAPRDGHSAMGDTKLLAQVYLAMTRGQNALEIKSGASRKKRRKTALAGAPIIVRKADDDEIAAHEARLDDISAAVSKSKERATADAAKIAPAEADKKKKAQAAAAAIPDAALWRR